MFRRRQTKKRKWPIILLIVFCVTGVVLGAGYYVLSTYTIKNVYVEGNVHYTQEEIQEIVMDGFLGNNSLYLSLKYKNKGIEDIPFVDVMDVSILSPDTIRITVYEKALAGYVTYMDSYMYFDKDGYVVESSQIKTEGVPQITGLKFATCTLGQKLPVEREEIFVRIMDLTKLLSKYKLSPDRIYFRNYTEITLYFADVRVALGEGDNLEDKLMVLPVFLRDLEGQKGVLRMENYTRDRTTTVFEKDESEKTD
ncbi:MAG: FtsQ-type POTRA domain-containing protein [bacterium]|nr:FtsQ-type POTRA domain-containing protein [bacterium]MCM1376387.1 FtsQ-type POTRA domain-containing protein [Muribaculum sp.]